VGELLEWIRLNADSKYPNSVEATAGVADHEWDALYSAWFTYQYGFLTPGRDLMQLEANELLKLNLSHE
jgi:hypothetical protein